jgi:hypothetical protein
MAIKTKCQRCGRFVGNGESCCGALKKVKIERRKPEDIDENAKIQSLADAIFGPGGELKEEDVDDDEGDDDEDDTEEEEE